MFAATTDTHQLHVRVDARPCGNAITGEMFPLTIGITLDAEEFQGCGRRSQDR
jgi:hypothetical protein